VVAGELFGALRGRLYDSNKNLIMTALTTIGGVASAMGPAVEKSSKVWPLKMIMFLYIYVYGLEKSLSLLCTGFHRVFCQIF
jgi:hypothetical protein